MALRIYHEEDADLTRLSGSTISVIGYGNQGQAHALNLRDSGMKVIVGQRPDGPGWRRAQADGFEPVPIRQAVDTGDLLIIALPDMQAPGVYEKHIQPALKPGQTLGFVHGFNIHYRQIVPPSEVDVIMVAPKGAGYMVRKAYVEGRGIPALVAVHHDAGGAALPIALAWAKGIGAARAGLIESTFAAETETDLFGEQVSVVGGVTALMKASFEVLIEAGYEPEHAYFECIHEVKYVVDLIHEGGFAAMGERISDTARYGGLSRSQRLAESSKPVMRQILQEIQSGEFAKEWIEEHQQGGRRTAGLLRAEAESLAEQVGRRLRGLVKAPRES